MIKLTVDEKIEIVLIVGDNYKTHREAAEIFNTRHTNKHISHVTVGNVVTKFKNTGSIQNNFKKKHAVRTLTEENQLQVLQTVVEHPKISLEGIKNAVQGNVSRASASKMLRINKFYLYKPIFVHTLKPGDMDSRFMFCAWFQGEVEDETRILFSDEATFTSNGVVCSQNCR